MCCQCFHNPICGCNVDLVTREVACPQVDWSYGEPTEMLSSYNSDGMADEIGESSGAYIIRTPFGPKDKYIPKELLWLGLALICFITFLELI
ncbi:hypothetical protein L1987_60053 [Smallanthus sonchifolius]|uniref:Uncharacterized protein n=1 Tax=Smallanthus sonchifolius TaxID=185202 RepID=A0ACB9D6Y0_9ASTR|nr:hypothetical protein L1987_60053 [Smallanthus sonchifolius]